MRVTSRGEVAVDAGLDAFCRIEHPKIVGLLTVYCGDRDIATELAQETMIRVIQHWKKVAGMDVPSAWTHRVAVNLANSWFRRTVAKRRAVRHLAGDAALVHVDPDSAANVAVRKAVADLPARQRAAVALRFYADLPVDDVARVMRCKPGTVWALTHQAIDSLRRAGLTDLPEVTHP